MIGLLAVVAIKSPIAAEVREGGTNEMKLDCSAAIEK